MELFHNLYNGFAVALTFQNILYCGFGVFVGQIIGVLPGIGAPTAIALPAFLSPSRLIPLRPSSCLPGSTTGSLTEVPSPRS